MDNSYPQKVLFLNEGKKKTNYWMNQKIDGVLRTSWVRKKAYREVCHNGRKPSSTVNVQQGPQSSQIISEGTNENYGGGLFKGSLVCLLDESGRNDL